MLAQKRGKRILGIYRFATNLRSSERQATRQYFQFSRGRKDLKDDSSSEFFVFLPSLKKYKIQLVSSS